MSKFLCFFVSSDFYLHFLFLFLVAQLDFYKGIPREVILDQSFDTEGAGGFEL